MSMLRRLFTAVKGGAREAGESIVDANAIRIFEQEIHEGKEAITAAKRNLTEVMAKEMQLTRHIKTLEYKTRGFQITMNENPPSRGITFFTKF